MNFKDQSFRIFEPSEIKITKRDIIGKKYIEILNKVEKIIYYQNNFQIEEGIKGFIFYGNVGTGKTTIAKVLAHNMAFKLIFIDGKDIARPKYGESENQISEIFQKARTYRRCLILIDDCESVFPTRDWIKGETWHIAQNNVFFHELDNLDTAKNSVILTTNRFDLIDIAIKDRLYNIEFPDPDKETLIAIAKQKAKKLKMENISGIMQKIDEKNFSTIRELEKNINEEYINEILKNKE